MAESIAIRSSSTCHSTSGVLRGAPSEIARLRAENKELRTNCSLWRKRAELHGEANLNLLKFARAVRDQASRIARDRNDLENRCLMLKQQLDGEYSYSDELRMISPCDVSHFADNRPFVQNATICQIKTPVRRGA